MTPKKDVYEKLKDLFVSRITNILEVSIENDVEALVLGAFGCGAFNNPPEVVASAFKEVFEKDRYKNAFKEVVFAIRSNGQNCVNLTAFRKVFD